MSRVLLAISLLAVIAGTASAAIFVPPPSPEASRPRPARPLEVFKAAKLEPMPNLENARPPVPIAHLPKRKPVAQAVAPTDEQPEAERGGPSEARAKVAVETDGYKGVRIVARLPDGRWKARAMRGSTEIGVTVGLDGSVRAD